jgi:hypothetical protein
MHELEVFPMASGIALIELGDSHEETLYSQVRFLQWRGYRVHLLVAAELEGRLPALGADELEVLPPLRTSASRLRALWRFRRYLARHHLRRAILNTAEGARARDACLLAGSNVELVGVLHNARKLAEGSVTQSMISRRIRKYFVLSDYIVENLRATGYAGRVGSFYPMFYPHRPDAKRTPDRSTLRICIPGNMSLRRRDYAGLREALTQGRLAGDVELTFLGNATRDDGPEIRNMFQTVDDRGACRFFPGFIEPETFYDEVAACDVILPLIHPSTPLFENYLTYQISGTFPLAFGFGKPMLMHEAFQGEEDFRDTALFYREPELIPSVNDLARDRSRLEVCARAAATGEKFRFENQARRYVEFLEEEP